MISCAIQFFSNYLANNRFVEWFTAFCKIFSEGFINHCLVTIAGFFRSGTKIINDIRVKIQFMHIIPWIRKRRGCYGDSMEEGTVFNSKLNYIGNSLGHRIRNLVRFVINHSKSPAGLFRAFPLSYYPHSNADKKVLMYRSTETGSDLLPDWPVLLIQIRSQHFAELSCSI